VPRAPKNRPNNCFRNIVPQITVYLFDKKLNHHKMDGALVDMEERFWCWLRLEVVFEFFTNRTPLMIIPEKKQLRILSSGWQDL